MARSSAWSRWAALAGAIALSAAGCVQVPVSGREEPSVHERYGKASPPPWAPAHGHRRKHHRHTPPPSVEIVYNGDLGVYVVINLPDTYFHDGSYYRIWDGTWQVGAALEGTWLEVGLSELPPGLRGKPAHKSHGSGLPARHP